MRIALIAAASLCAPAVAAAAQPAAIEIQLSNFKFEPRTIELKAGQDYVLTLVNASGGGHNFTARDFFAVAGVNAADRAMVRNGTIEVPGRSQRVIRLRAPTPGAYKVKCTHTLHGAFGMRGEIRVR